MSTQRAYRPDFPESLPERRSIPTERPRRRRLRFFLLGLVLFLLSVIGSAAVLIYSPTVLESMSTMILKPQAGVVPWNGHDRITFIAMGLTQRTTEPARTDTILAIDIDPATHHINELSVPRDLWVDIPGYGYGKLAIAYEIGGPKLAAYTLERDLGIPADYAAAMTFHGFINLIDAMGGVDVNVPQELKDPTYPCLTGYAYCPIDIKPGPQHMDGATALEFVRERHAFAQQDLARVQDQQAFADAVKRTLMSPHTWLRLPDVFNAFRQALITNMPLNALPAMGVQYMLAGSGRVNHSYINIENGLVQTGWSNDGQSILTPTSTTAITNLVHQLFGDPRLAQEHASVAVLNGSANGGEASDVQTTLQNLGFNASTAGNADRSDYARSEVIVNTAVSGSVEYSARRLARILDATLVHQPVPGQSAQIVAIVGSDFPAVGTGQ